MDDPSGRPPAGGVAQRRRERRLRAQLRHEQQTVRMVLATVTHHSFQVGTAHDGPTGTEDSHQHQGGGGASSARRPTGTEGSSTGDAAGSPAGSRAAGTRWAAQWHRL